MKTKHELTGTIGNKAANLVALESMLKDYSETLGELKTLTVTVPQICPLTHHDISKHLTQYAPGWIELWEQFKIAQGTESSNLTTDAAEILKQLRQLIKETFIQHPYVFAELSDFLKTMDPDSLLMVRSTGKEDAVDIANPGGNESVASVRQDPVSISNAIGTVVASYFSDKSLLQRLSGKQDILEDAFMPVLVQKMISEVADHVDNPVVSGVMYTCPAGIQIQMAPGHGEYIVNSKGPFDTIYVSREHVVHAEINEKKQRLVPAESGLTWQANSPALATSLSIDRRVAADIASVGRCVQDYYEMPMDVEFVYDPTSHAFSLVQARPIPPGSSKLVPPSSIAPTQVVFVKEHGDMIKAQVITPAGNAVQLITKPEEILITGNISDALDTYLHHQDNVFKAVVITEKAPQTSHEAAQFNSMGIPVLQVTAAFLKQLEERMQKPDTVLMVDPQRKSIIDWTKNIKNHATAQEEIKASGIIEEGLFQSSLSLYESLLPIFKEHPFHIKSVPDDLSSSMGDLIDKSNSEDSNTSEQAFNALMQRLFSNLTTSTVESVSLYESFEQLKATKNPEALQKIVSQLYHLARNTSETVEMQTLYKLIFQHAVIDSAEISSAIHNPAISQQEWLDTVARLELLVTAPFNPALQTSSIHQLLEIKQSRAKASNVAGFNALTDEQQQYFISFFQLGKLIVNDEMRDKWTKFALSTCRKSPKYQALSTLMYFLHENGIAADWLNSYFDPKKSIAGMGTECSKIINELRPLNLPDIRNKINEWEKRLPEWSDPKNFDHLYVDYIKDVTAMIEHLDTASSQHPLTQKTVLKVVQDLTEMMDKTIKSLKGSPEYREHSALLVERFYALLTPYKSLMEKWIKSLPPTTFEETDVMLKYINQCFQDLSTNKAVRQLNPSGRINIPAVTIDNFKLSEISRRGVSSDITLEDLFSLIHQNILIATTLLGKDSQIKPKQLPVSLNALHAELSEKAYENNGPGQRGSSIAAALMSTTLNYPMIHLDYNLPLRNHSAKFFLNYNQETGEITFNAKFFGHNDGERMDLIAQLVQIEGDFLNVQPIRVARYDHKSQLLEWTWAFNEKELQAVLKSIHAMIQNCCDMTYYEYRDTVQKCMNQMLSRHEDIKPALPANIPKSLQEFVDKLPLEKEKILIPTLFGYRPVDSKTILVKTCENEQSIQLTYLLQSDVKNNPNQNLLRFTVDYDFVNNTVDFKISISCIIKNDADLFDPDPKLSYDNIESILLSAELEGALLNAQMISSPHFNDKTNEINWCWRLNNTENIADLLKTVIKSFIRYAYYNIALPMILNIYAKEATIPAREEQIIQCVKDFFAQEKHIRCAIDRPDGPAKEWIKLDDLKADLPPELLPAAATLHLFDRPEHVEKLIQAQKSIGEGLKALKGNNDPTIVKKPGSTF